MGFYGNITNTSRTQFQFDKVYTSRKLMDDSAASDGIYAGRYVLVNYEEDGGSDYYIPAYKINTASGFQFGSSYNGEVLTRFKYVSNPTEAINADVVYEGQVVSIPPDGRHNVSTPTSTKWEFWKVEGFVTVDNVRYASFRQYADLYSLNYNIDVDAYGTSRGYDSTVWQKTYQGGRDKYVMIAELNTIVPTFDIEADAPKMVPLTPHFDADSTNVYYKLHWSPSWGLRVKGANPALTGPILNDDGTDSMTGFIPLTSDEKQYPSDETTNWYKTVYDGNKTVTEYIFTVDETGKYGRWIPLNESDRNIDSQGLRESVIEAPAAIYYNKDGFDPKRSSYSYFETQLTETDYEPYVYYKKIDGKYILSTDLSFDSNETYYQKIEDHIQLTPTGRSGHMYNRHDGSITDSVQEDTQELSIMLPAIGNTIAAVWDLMYGGEEVNEGPMRNLDISWETARRGMNRHGLRLVNDFNFDGQYLYKTKNVDTIAGAINSVHDLMGMIITAASTELLENNINALDENRIYYNQDNHTFNRKTLQYDYIPLTDEAYDYEEVSILEDMYVPGHYYLEDNGQYIVDNSSTFDNSKTYYLRKLNDDNEFELESNLFLFDGKDYAYQDFVGTDLSALDPTQLDYIRDEKFYPDKTYYRWDEIEVETYSDLSNAYEKNHFYYQDEQGNYRLAQDEVANTEVQYFTLNSNNIATVESLGYGGVYVPGKYLYLDGENYRIDTSPTVTDRRTYYTLDTSEQTEVNGKIYSKTVTYDPIVLTEETYVQNMYYIWIGSSPRSHNDADYQLSSSTSFNSHQTYYVRNETLSLINNQYYQVDASRSFILVQFHEHEFFYRNEVGDYIALTRLSEAAELTGDIVVLRSDINEHGTYVLSGNDFTDTSVSAFIYQDQFYEAGKFHYVLEDYSGDEYSDYILDNYPTKTHGSNYLQIKSVGNPINIKFYRGYQFYEKNPTTGEYTLITVENEIPDVPIYSRKTYYVYEDKERIYQKGAIWNFDAAYVPASVTLATRTGHYGLEPFADFARNINTMHGMLLKIKAILDYENIDTRDVRTVQGAINTLNDKIAQFSTLHPGDILIADDYGRVHSAEAKETNWTKILVDTQIEHPSIRIEHKFNPVADTSHTTNLTTSTGTVNLIDVKPIVDTMGHTVGKHTETYQLPFGYGKIQGDTGTELAAGGSNATIKLEGSDNWIATEVATESGAQKVKVTHEFTAGTNVASTVDLSTNTSASFVDISAITDAKGHVIATDSKTIQFPHGYGLVAADSGTALAAGNTYATLTIGGADNWIATTATTGQKISVSHSNPVTDGATAIGPTMAQSPGFGETFNIPSLSIDAKGHVAVTGSLNVTIPSITLTSGNNSVTNAVLTTLTYSNGSFVSTETSPLNLLLTGYDSLASQSGAIAASDTIGNALKKLESQISSVGTNAGTNLTATIATLNSDGATATTGQVISAVSQTNGIISVSTKDLDTADIPGLSTLESAVEDLQSVEHVYSYTPTGEASPQTITLKNIYERLLALEAANTPAPTPEEPESQG